MTALVGYQVSQQHPEIPATTRVDTGVPSYYRQADESSLKEELAQEAKGNDTTWMGRQILPYIAVAPRFAEGTAILRKLVYASHYGAKDTDTSRRAFKLLHKQYTNSPEAQ